MIVPMKKVSLIIMGDKKSDTLRKLRKLGILHIESVEGSGRKLEELKEKVAILESAGFSLSEKKNKKIKQEDIDTDKAICASKEIIALEDEKKLCSAEQITLTAELDRLSAWGELDPGKLNELAGKGVDITLYEMPKAEYAALGESVKTLSFQQTKNSVKFLLIKSGLEGEDEIVDSLKSFRFELPEKSTAEIRQKIEALNNRIKEIDEKISSFAGYADGIKKAAFLLTEKPMFLFRTSRVMLRKKTSIPSRKPQRTIPGDFLLRIRQRKTMFRQSLKTTSL